MTLLAISSLCNMEVNNWSVLFILLPTGSVAHKKFTHHYSRVFTHPKKILTSIQRQVFIFFVNCARRHASNVFADSERQAAINLFFGLINSRSGLAHSGTFEFSAMQESVGRSDYHTAAIVAAKLRIEVILFFAVLLSVFREWWKAPLSCFWDTHCLLLQLPLNKSLIPLMSLEDLIRRSRERLAVPLVSNFESLFGDVSRLPSALLWRCCARSLQLFNSDRLSLSLFSRCWGELLSRQQPTESAMFATNRQKSFVLQYKPSRFTRLYKLLFCNVIAPVMINDNISHACNCEGVLAYSKECVTDVAMKLKSTFPGSFSKAGLSCE